MAQDTERPMPDQSALVDENGVDRSLIRWMLGLTPTERLRYLDDHNSVLASAKRFDKDRAVLPVLRATLEEQRRAR
jgi:hypothetical protein